MAGKTSSSSYKKRKKAQPDRSSIKIKGARVHNLQNVSVDIPRNKLVVVTGVSGSGKSSLTMDTLYAEGQRRYVESLSSYARQFMMRMNKPDVDAILGICPAIALEQKVSTRTTRSTVGSLTEIYDYLRLLYARTGKTISPVSGNEVRRHEVSDVVDLIGELEAGTKVQLVCPLQSEYERDLSVELNLLIQKGYSRVLVDDTLTRMDDLLEQKRLPKRDRIRLLVDRFVVKHEDEDLLKRIADSASTAFYESGGFCELALIDGPSHTFSNRFELDGIKFESPSDHFFNYNNPYGACKRCEGFGTVIGIDEDLVIPDKSRSLYEQAVAPWRGDKMKAHLNRLIKIADTIEIPLHKPIADFSETQWETLWQGKGSFKGLNGFFKKLEKDSYKIQYRVMLSRYRGRTPCTECRGTRLRKDAHYVKVDDKSITDLLLMSVGDINKWMAEVKLNEWQAQIAGRIIVELRQRLGFMMDVGLSYLTLNRRSNTLSGGESQRINLTRQLGSNLTSSLYILDEPSVGLHPRDTARLVRVLKRLRDLGNTVVVVEHEEDVMKAADHIIDMGPFAGVHGGKVTAEGSYAEILIDDNSLTGAYLSEREKLEVPKSRRKVVNRIKVEGASQHNLKNIDVEFPLNMLTAVTGVSGSGKTTLVKSILVPAMRQAVEEYGEKPGAFKGLSGDVKSISGVEMVDQNPIGKSSRSNPVTYIKAYDAIRDLYSKQPASKTRGFQPKHFSFNVDGGRCDACKGEGEIIVEMQFLADVHLECEDCGGKRFKPEVLEVRYGGKNISEILDLSVDEAITFFEKAKDIARKLSPLQEVGLGYVKLGQSASTLSGGEAQRVKLASFLSKGKNTSPILFVFDEPTTGLHFHDIKKLLTAFNALIERGHSVIVVEHNVEVIKSCDYVIDLGAEGGINGGNLVFSGRPEAMTKNWKKLGSYTGEALSSKL
ncbi:MAG: excinuclease ABC subunit A [Limisphaerales bacterium]|jgi:excinuclease ABC subunit A